MQAKPDQTDKFIGAGWIRQLPLVRVLAGYQREDFRHDLVAGLIVAVISVPQAVAYAFLAGLPPEAGLYACLLPMFLYALLGSSRHLIVGPVAVAALMFAATLAEHAPHFEHNYLAISTVVCIEVGVLLLLLRLSGASEVVNLVSHPVINGFINAAAILIIISQLNPFLGIPGTDAGIPLANLLATLQSYAAVNPATLILGVVSLALLLIARSGIPALAARLAPYAYSHRLLRRAFAATRPHHFQLLSRAAPLVTLIVAMLAVSVLGLEEQFAVKTAGDVPSGLPVLALPPIDPLMWLQLMPAAAMIAAVVFVESYTIASAVAGREHRRIETRQELVALGAANLAAGLSGASPVAGSFSRTSVNYESGARTPVSSLICVAVILLTLLLFTPLFAALPHTTLAAIVIVSILGLVNFANIRKHWQQYREDGITEVVTLVTVLAFGVETGLIIGVLLSITLFMRRSSRPHITLVGRIKGTDLFRATKRHEDAETFEHIAAVRIDENIFFANANNVEDRLEQLLLRRPATAHVLLVCSAINVLDVSGIEMLRRLNRRLRTTGILLHLAEVKWPVMSRLTHTHFIEELSGKVFRSASEALDQLASMPESGQSEPVA